MSKDSLQTMLDFLALLRAKGITFRIERQTPEALMVTFTSEGKCVEVDFFVNEVWFSHFGEAATGSMTDNTLRNFLRENWGD